MPKKAAAEEEPGAEPPAPPKRRTSRIYVRKTDIVLTAAERVFLRAGFAATSMDDVADEAGVSKRTVYSNFGSKERLFAEVVGKRCASVVPDPATFAAALGQPVDEGLRLLAVAFLKGIFHPAQVELYQTVVAAVRRRPEVGRIMYEGPITQSQRLFADYLRVQAEAGKLALDDVELAASQLIALLKTNIHMKLLFGQPVRIGPKLIDSSARASVELFLHGALPRR
ncbi:TetR/AcrR family transcriptional regulator [uncultured Sphingomonas sp.]|uniref:TetR/AcrR family transcriptional regulator n=1 Tax=uncultured Sphingomonas sp. TaxID=158754 RepID=UPI0035C96D43